MSALSQAANGFGRMAESLCASSSPYAKPEFLGDRCVRLIDASDETTKGKDKTTWRLHYDFDLFDFKSNIELATNKEGEKLTRHAVHEGDIIIAAITESKRKMERKVSKKQEKQIQADTAELNEYIVIITSLDYANEQVLELYR